MSTNQNPMEYIWDRIPKQKDGKTIRYLKGDIDYLYLHGFVDTRNYKLEEWKKAFEPYKQSDGSYVLNREQFLTLRIYRYDGPSDEIFDGLKIKEGPWSDADLQTLYDRSIGIASSLKKETFWAYINSLKKHKHYTDKDGNFLMDMPAKIGLDGLVRIYPSPRALLEREVRRIRLEKDKTRLKNQFARDTSGFSVGQTESENREAAFKKLQSNSGPAAKPPIDPTKETIDIKSLRKPGSKFRG